MGRRTSSSRAGRAPARRRGLAWIAALGLVAALAAGLVVAGSPRQPADAQSAPAVTVQRAHAGSATPTLKRRIVLLTIGSDAGAPKFGRGGSVEGGRADALQLIVLDTVKRRGAVLSFPRDIELPIPGHGTNKINAAMAFGEARLLVATFERLTGLPIDYYALTSFDGLTDIVTKVGGVQVNVDMNLRDTFAGAFLDKGRQKLNGRQALAYARPPRPCPAATSTAPATGPGPRGRPRDLPAPGRPGPGQGHDLARRHARRGQDRPAVPRAPAPGPARHQGAGQRHRGSRPQRRRRRRRRLVVHLQPGAYALFAASAPAS